MFLRPLLHVVRIPDALQVPSPQQAADADVDEFQNFTDAILDELRASGIPETGRPFSLDSFWRSVSKITLLRHLESPESLDRVYDCHIPVI